MKYFRYKSGTLKIHLIVVSILSLVSYPMFCFVYSMYMDANNQLEQYGDEISYAAHSELISHIGELGNTMRYLLIIGAVALILLFFTGFVIVTRNFRYLYDKNYADRDMSLPVSAKTRFFGDFFSGLAVYTVPHIIGILIGAAFIGPIEPESSLSTFSNGIYSAMVTGLLMCIEFYCMTLVILSVCGRLAKVVKLTLLMNIFIPACSLSAATLSMMWGYGIPSVSWADIMTAGIFSPLGLLIRFVSGLQIIRFDTLAVASDIPFCIMTLVYCAALTATAYFLIIHRRHERTGEAYVYKYARRIVSLFVVFTITTVIGMFTLASIVNYEESEYTRILLGSVFVPTGIAWLVSTVLFYIACEFSDRNKEKKLPKLALLAQSKLLN